MVSIPTNETYTTTEYTTAELENMALGIIQVLGTVVAGFIFIYIIFCFIDFKLTMKGVFIKSNQEEIEKIEEDYDKFKRRLPLLITIAVILLIVSGVINIIKNFAAL